MKIENNVLTFYVPEQKLTVQKKLQRLACKHIIRLLGSLELFSVKPPFGISDETVSLFI